MVWIEERRGLYAIVDPEHSGARSALAVAEAILDGGCAVLQLRAKSLPDGEHLALAERLVRLCRGAGVPFVLNDRPDIAILSGADGVHLGQDDLPLDAVRRILSAPRASMARASSPWGRVVIGLSTHDLAQARAAVAAGADYIGFGPIFETTSKKNPDPCVGLDGLSAVLAVVDIPVVAIGGIMEDRAATVAQTGAPLAAAIGALTKAEDPAQAARTMHRAWSGESAKPALAPADSPKEDEG